MAPRPLRSAHRPENLSDGLEYRQTYHAIVSKQGTIRRWSEGGPPVLYASPNDAAKDCGDGERVVAVRLLWKQPAP